MDNVKICSVFGHRNLNITTELSDKLFDVFESLIISGCEHFYFGGFGVFDELCHKIISELKKKYPNLQRVFCLSDPRHQRANKRPNWLCDDNYEAFVYLDLEFDWWYQRIYFRNCAMIDKSDVIIFYAQEKENSGAYKAYKYALKKKKHIINLYQKG